MKWPRIAIAIAALAPRVASADHAPGHGASEAVRA